MQATLCDLCGARKEINKITLVIGDRRCPVEGRTETIEDTFDLCGKDIAKALRMAVNMLTIEQQSSLSIQLKARSMA